MAINAPNWESRTTERHAWNTMRQYWQDQLAAAERTHAALVDRWQADCAADGVAPDDEREFWGIDQSAARLAFYQAAAIGFSSAY